MRDFRDAKAMARTLQPTRGFERIE